MSGTGEPFSFIRVALGSCEPTKLRFPTIVLLSAGLFACSARAQQAPDLLWTKNVGATLFAIDAQTKLYANSGGKVITLNGAGLPLSTNLICPITNPPPGIVRRDASGNYWFLGNFDGPNNFGGTTLIGGWTNYPTSGHWTPGYPTCYLAKYNANGQLQFVKAFGAQAHINVPTDLAIDNNGGAYLGYRYYLSGQEGRIRHFSSTGSFDWEFAFSSTDPFALTLSGVTSSNCAYFYYNAPLVAVVVSPGTISLTGSNSYFPSPNDTIRISSSYATNGKPVIDDLGRVFQAGICGGSCSGQVILRKLDTTGPVWTLPIGPEEQFTLARDPDGNVYLGGVTGTFSQYSTDGALIWSTNYGQIPISMLLDSYGTRFLNLANGAIARLSGQTGPQTPSANLFVIPAAGDGLSSDGFRFSLVGSTQSVWQILGSSNLSSWNFLGTITNTLGQVQFTDPAAANRPRGFYKAVAP